MSLRARRPQRWANSTECVAAKMLLRGKRPITSPAGTTEVWLFSMAQMGQRSARGSTFSIKTLFEIIHKRVMDIGIRSHWRAARRVR